MILLTCIIKVDQSHFYVKKHAAGLFHLIRKKKQYAGPVPLLCKKTRCGIIPLNKEKNNMRDQQTVVFVNIGHKR